MTLVELNTVLKSATGFSQKVAYRAWPEGAAPSLPFICYVALNTDNFAADGIAYSTAQIVDVELYTKHKDTASEAAVEAALTTAGIYWEKSEEYLDDENCFEIIYSITI